MQNKKDPALTAIVIFIILIGLAIRLTPALQTNFPLNDGGLFYAMILDLQAAHFALPAFATYNSASIPFAYPPLAFYLTGLLASLFHVPTLNLVRLLPPIVSALTIPAFYLLARAITPSKIQVTFSVLAFTLLPRVFEWNIMGGGITRAFGLLFALSTLTSAYQFYEGHQARHFWTSILFGALTVLTHPEATVHTALTALVFYLWKDRSPKGLLKSLGIAAGILALTAPWWGVVVARFGIAPFQAAMTASAQDSYNALVGLVIFFRFLFTDEAFLEIFACLGLIGLFASLARKQTFLPGWFFIIHLLEPRGGTLYMMLPLSLLIGYSLETVIFPAFGGLPEQNTLAQDFKAEFESRLRNKASRYFLLFLFAYGTMSAYSTSLKIKDIISLQPADLEAMTWVKENLPPDSQFAVLTGNLPLRDSVSEWFPVLTGRHSQATLFGYEWVNDKKFGQRVSAYNGLQACLSQDAHCLGEWSKQSGEPIQYVYLWHPETIPSLLDITLRQEPDYELVYKSAQISIYHHLGNE